MCVCCGGGEWVGESEPMAISVLFVPLIVLPLRSQSQSKAPWSALQSIEAYRGERERERENE